MLSARWANGSQMAASHREAVLAALNANSNLTVVDGPAPKGTAPPYVVTYVYIPTETRNKVNSGTNETTVSIVTHSTAANTQSVAIVARQVRSSLLDQVMAVTGYVCTRITHESGSPPDWDDSTGVVVMAQIDQWDYTARLA